ncbi:MAG: GNAT family N-acetyltransferase [Actinomycetota bacterium]|nr:GNAT family N-acetyltransferase [Actinomycetota bacterium]
MAIPSPPGPPNRQETSEEPRGDDTGRSDTGHSDTGRPRSEVRIRALRRSDCGPAARLHLQVLDAEFISRFGFGFLRSYYRAWLGADAALALVACDPAGKVVGLLLGAVDPPAHSSSMVRRHWPALSAHLAVACARDPGLARDLLATRATRYARGLARATLGHARRSAAPVAAAQEAAVASRPPSAPVEAGTEQPLGAGEVTHLLVDPGAQGTGVGRLLVAAAEEAARQAGLHELELVTPVEEQGARRFYERIGWVLDQPVTSSSGERFVRYRRRLAAG